MRKRPGIWEDEVMKSRGEPFGCGLHSRTCRSCNENAEGAPGDVCSFLGSSLSQSLLEEVVFKGSSELSKSELSEDKRASLGQGEAPGAGRVQPASRRELLKARQQDCLCHLHSPHRRHAPLGRAT